jgi:putative DNA primase/helicase
MTADVAVRNQKIKRVIDGKPEPKPGVEILAHGSQTVIPPSWHPDNIQYRWIGKELLDAIESDFPLLTPYIVDEIRAHCEGKGACFTGLNEMVWLGLGGGGNTHDCCVAAVAAMVTRSWPEAEIYARVIRAKQEACERAGTSLDWPGARTAIQEWIDSAKRKGMEGTATPKKAPAERIMADWAIGYLGGKELLATVNGRLRYYQDGHWPEVNLDNLKREMYHVNPNLRRREAENAIEIVHTLTTRPVFGWTEGEEPRHDPKRQRICLLNGTMNIKTGDLEQWSPDHETIHQLQFEWNDEATCPNYDRVIRYTLNDDETAIRLWDEFCAHTLVMDMSFQKVLFLLGPGGNGKGTIAKVLRNLHNPTAVGSVAVTDLNDERKRTSLIGKLVNISGEQSRLNLVSDTYLKKITGGDPIDVRRLYGEVQNNVVLTVRFLELVNEMPTTTDSSFALQRRLIILPCPNKVVKPDLQLDAKLMVERPGILRRWLVALQRLYERGYFDIPHISDVQVTQYRMESDPVLYWIESQTTPDQDGTIGTELYSHFMEWCKMMGYMRPVPEVVWGKILTREGYDSRVLRKGKVVFRGRLLRLQTTTITPF